MHLSMCCPPLLGCTGDLSGDLMQDGEFDSQIPYMLPKASIEMNTLARLL